MSKKKEERHEINDLVIVDPCRGNDISMSQEYRICIPNRGMRA